VFIENDARYFGSAVTIHALWAFTWIIVSLPLIFTWQYWFGIRNRALTLVSLSESDAKEKELKVKALLELYPVSTWTVITSSIAGVVAFVLPLLQPLWK
jgi:hypothetical protein